VGVSLDADHELNRGVVGVGVSVERSGTQAKSEPSCGVPKTASGRSMSSGGVELAPFGADAVKGGANATALASSGARFGAAPGGTAVPIAVAAAGGMAMPGGEVVKTSPQRIK